MNIYSILEHNYPQLLKKLNEKFPKMAQFSKEVEVVAWDSEYEIADKNPEVIDTIEFLDMLLENGVISQEKYQEKIREFGYASKTLGIAFIDEKKVSFREKVPKQNVIVHELGHVYFKENDLTWNAVYGAGESFLWLTLADRTNLDEEQIKKYMEIYKYIYSLKSKNILLKIYRKLSEIVTRETTIPADLLAAKVFAGTMPNTEVFEDSNDYKRVFADLDSQKIAERLKNEKISFSIDGLKSEMLMFLSAGLADGYRYNDPFYKKFADNFFANIDEMFAYIKMREIIG